MTLLIIYIISIIIYFLLLRVCTIKKTQWGIINDESATISFIFGIIPILNIITYFAFIFDLIKFKFKKSWWKVLLFIKEKNE